MPLTLVRGSKEAGSVPARQALAASVASAIAERVNLNLDVGQTRAGLMRWLPVLSSSFSQKQAGNADFYSLV